MMICYWWSPTTVLVTTAIVVLLMKQAGADLATSPTYEAGGCYASSGNYSANSFYYNSIKTVLSDLASQASSGSRSYSSSSGTADETSAAYGVYYCRGDVPSTLCSACVKAATQVVSQGGACFPIKEGVVWYQECTLQYSNQSKLGVMETAPWASRNSLANVSNPATFGLQLATNMKGIISSAAYGSNGSSSLSSGFATGKEDVSAMETLYTLVQCRPDINGSSCEDCLKSAYNKINTCCANYSAQKSYVFYPTCILMYNLVPFYFTAAASAAASSSQDFPSGSSGSSNIIKVAIPIVAIFLFLVLGGGLLIYWRKKKNEAPNNASEVVTKLVPEEEQQPENRKDIGNVQCFNFKIIESATANFSDINKLGEGGFGSVYKGILPNGQAIAVKRLSRSSEHHIREFTTEVAVLAKLQHRNLVTLLGFSAYQEERILAYEFLPNLSLDKILFDSSKSIYMDWTTRFKIIEGIAWGLRYLHVDSLLTIVHRDLKTSNILLDKEMSPKIADFGLAKLVTLNQTTVNVTTVAGTMGYMAPEYLMAGRCTVKSDIYSFGVMILEIISGKSIAKFYDPITNDGLLHYAWRLWNERAIEGLMDPGLQNQYSRIESERCVQIGLLCVQDDEEKRPTIRILMSMLDNQSLELPYPTASTYYRSKTPQNNNPSTISQEGQTQMTQTDLYQASNNNLLQNPYPR